MSYVTAYQEKILMSAECSLLIFSVTFKKLQSFKLKNNMKQMMQKIKQKEKRKRCGCKQLTCTDKL